MEKKDQSESTQISVQIDGEHETSNGWLYTLSIQWADASASDHEITLSWVDHEHLVGGAVRPSAVVKAAALLAAEFYGQQEMPPRCDVASLRRRIERFDEQVRNG